MFGKWSVVGLVGLLAACGGKASADDGGSTGGQAGAAAGGQAGAGGSAFGGQAGAGASAGAAGGGAGGMGGTANTGGSAGAECVVKGDGWGDNVNPTCSDLSVLGVSEPVVTGGGANGSVSAGDSFNLAVVLSEVAGEGFSVYPGVKFESDNVGVTIKENDWYYAIAACASYDASATGKVDPSVAPGTVVTLTARVAMLNNDCPSAPSLKVKLTIN